MSTPAPRVTDSAMVVPDKRKTSSCFIRLRLHGVGERDAGRGHDAKVACTASPPARVEDAVVEESQQAMLCPRVELVDVGEVEGATAGHLRRVPRALPALPLPAEQLRVVLPRTQRPQCTSASEPLRPLSRWRACAISRLAGARRTVCTGGHRPSPRATSRS